MIKLQGIQADVVGGIGSLSAVHALFTIEFERDNRLLVCHTCAATVRKAVGRLIRKILGPKETNLPLRQALLQSEYITVRVMESGMGSPHEILKAKYDLIRDNKAYEPYGYNSLAYGVCGKEKAYSDMLMASLRDETDRGAKAGMRELQGSGGSNGGRGGSSKARRVYAYDRATGLYVKGFLSAGEASDDTGVCRSSISLCCGGRINTAGSYIWSYDKAVSVAVPGDGRRKRVAAVSGSEADRLQSRRLQFIKGNGIWAGKTR